MKITRRNVQHVSKVSILVGLIGIGLGSLIVHGVYADMCLLGGGFFFALGLAIQLSRQLFDILRFSILIPMIFLFLG